MTGKGRGSGKTPERLVNLLKDAVSKSNQSKVASETGLTRLTLQNYLKGIGEPTSSTLGKLADYFGVSVAELRGEEKSFAVTTMAIPTTNIRGIAAVQSEYLVLFRFENKMIFATSRNEFCAETMKLLGHYFSQTIKNRKPESVLETIESIWSNKAENIEEFLSHNGNKMMHPDDDLPPAQDLDLDEALAQLGMEVVDVIPLDELGQSEDNKE